MDFSIINCQRCGIRSSVDLGSSYLCQSCGTELVPHVRCAWCANWSSNHEQCVRCGSAIYDKSLFPMVRMLRQKGIAQSLVAIELENMQAESRDKLKQEFSDHLALAEKLLTIIRPGCMSFLDKDFFFDFETRFISALPFDSSRHKILQKAGLRQDSEADQLLRSIAANPELGELSDVAAIILFRNPGLQVNAKAMQTCLNRVIDVAINAGPVAIEAMIALAHWRTLMQPVEIEVYTGKYSKSLYEVAYSELCKSDDLQAYWLAVLCARCEAYQKLSSSDQLKQLLAHYLDNGLHSEDQDLRFSCALLQNNQVILADFIQSQNKAIADLALTKLLALESSYLIELTQLDASGVGLSVLKKLSKHAGNFNLSEDLLEALLQGIDTYGDQLDENDVEFLSQQSKRNDRYLHKFTHFMLSNPKFGVSLDTLIDNSAGDCGQVQKILMHNSLNPDLLSKLVGVCKSRSVAPIFADYLVRYFKLCFRAEVNAELIKNIKKLLLSQLHDENPSAFIFKRFVVENLLSENSEISNKLFSLLEYELDAIVALETVKADSNYEAFSADFCQYYFGSVDNCLSLLNKVLANYQQYECSSWLLSTLFKRQYGVRELLCGNPHLAKSIINSLLVIYQQKQFDLDSEIVEFLCAPSDQSQGGLSPFYELMDFEVCDQGLLDLLYTASFKYKFSRRLVSESLQYLEYNQDKKYIDQIQVILANQCNREFAFAYFCVSYLLKNSFNVENPALANNAYTIFAGINAKDISYIGPQDHISYKLRDLGNFLRNFFTSIDSFSQQFLNVINEQKVFGIELWLISRFQQNQDLVTSCFDQELDKLHQIISALIKQLIQKKYTGTSQGLALGFIKKFLFYLPVSDLILTKTGEMLAQVRVGEDMHESLLAQLSLISTACKTANKPKLVHQETHGEAELAGAGSLLQDNEVSTGLADFNFEVSIQWLTDFELMVKRLDMTKLLQLMSLFHNNLNSFKALLKSEPELHDSLINTLIELLFVRLFDRNYGVGSQLLLLTELIHALVTTSQQVHFSIITIKSKLSASPQDTPVYELIKQMLSRLAEARVETVLAGRFTDEINQNQLSENFSIRRLTRSNYYKFDYELAELEKIYQDPDLKAYLSTAWLLMEENKYIEAINQIKKMLDIDQTDHTYYLLAKAYLLYGLPEQASKYFEKCLVLNPHNIHALLLYAYQHEQINANLKFAENLATRAYEINPKSDQALARLSSICLRKGDNSQAMRYLTDALKLNRENAQLYYLLGEILQKSQRYKESITYLNKAISLGIDDASAYSALGVSEYKLGNVNEAVKYLKQAIASDEYYSAAYFNLAEIYYASGDKQKAEFHFTKACQFDPDNRQYKLGFSEYYHEVGELKKAQELLKQIIDSKSFQIDDIIKLARLYGLDGQYHEAQESLEKVIKIQPRNAKVYFELALLYEKTNNFGDAVGLLQRAIDIDPSFAMAWVEMGDIYRGQNRLDKAQSCYERVLESNNDHAQALIGIAHIYRQTGDIKKANKFFKKAEKLR